MEKKPKTGWTEKKKEKSELGLQELKYPFLSHVPVCYTPPHSPSTCIQQTGWRHCFLPRGHWQPALSLPFLELRLLVS